MVILNAAQVGGNSGACKHLIESNADLNEQVAQRAACALHGPITCGRHCVVTAVLRSLSQVNGDTPLIAAAACGSVEASHDRCVYMLVWMWNACDARLKVSVPRLFEQDKVVTST